MLRNKWLSAGLFVSILFAYELFDLCKFVCPIGQFNFVASLVSPSK